MSGRTDHAWWPPHAATAAPRSSNAAAQRPAYRAAHFMRSDVARPHPVYDRPLARSASGSRNADWRHAAAIRAALSEQDRHHPRRRPPHVRRARRRRQPIRARAARHRTDQGRQGRDRIAQSSGIRGRVLRRRSIGSRARQRLDPVRPGRPRVRAQQVRQRDPRLRCAVRREGEGRRAALPQARAAGVDRSLGRPERRTVHRIPARPAHFPSRCQARRARSVLHDLYRRHDGSAQGRAVQPPRAGGHRPHRRLRGSARRARRGGHRHAPVPCRRPQHHVPAGNAGRRHVHVRDAVVCREVHGYRRARQGHGEFHGADAGEPARLAPAVRRCQARHMAQGVLRRRAHAGLGAGRTQEAAARSPPHPDLRSIGDGRAHVTARLVPAGKARRGGAAGLQRRCRTLFRERPACGPRRARRNRQSRRQYS